MSPASTWRRTASSRVAVLSGPSWSGSSRRRLITSWYVKSTVLLEALDEDLGDVPGLDLVGDLLALHPVLEHGEAKGACRRQDIGLHRHRLLDAHLAHPAALVFFHPRAAATAAAAEALGPVQAHLDQVLPGRRGQHPPRLLVHVVVPAQVARVVISDALGAILRDLQAPRGDQLVQELAVVDHLEAAV